MKEVNLEKYLPPVIKDAKEMQEITKAETPVISQLWADIENVEKDQFVEDATITGVRRWESMLSITPKAIESIEERKARILMRLNEQPPYTIRVLRNWLEGAYGEGHYLVDLIHKEYLLNVELYNVVNTAYYDVYDMLLRTVPANLVITMLLSTVYPEEESEIYVTGDNMGSITDIAVPDIETSSQTKAKMHFVDCFCSITSTILPDFITNEGREVMA